MRIAFRRITAFLAVVPVLAAGAAPPAEAAPRDEGRLVDAVPAPRLDWQPCHDIAECATVRLPLDYDEPTGATIGIGVLRIRAKDPANRIGCLFVNPGGPGGSATEMALGAPNLFSPELLDRFDIVGVDPRGIGRSEHLDCFTSAEDRAAVLDLFDVPFPVTAAENQAYVRGSQLLGRACSTTGGRLAGSVSTAEVARDMDVIRRAVGDPKLTYYGKSYGSQLGQVYAAMFPSRFRAVAVDGVVDPVAWAGRDPGQILDARVHFSDGAYRALAEVLRRCDRAGKRSCVFASADALRDYDTVARRLLRTPLTVGSATVTYADFVMATLLGLSTSDAGAQVTRLAADTRAVLDGRATSEVRQRLLAAVPPRGAAADNVKEAGTAVLCTDGLFPADAAGWPAAVDARNRRAPYFGSIWGWFDSVCASDTWTARDEDAFAGPFNRWTTAPILLVGGLHDPGTGYAGAVRAHRTLPHSTLLTSNNWGHTSYGTGACVTAGIDTYLLTGVPPARTLCTDAPQPFTDAAPPRVGVV